MPGLVKIGFSMRDPVNRASELDNTGSPHPYVVEYDMLIEDPQQLEKQVHETLKNANEGKEWFRCSVHDAIKEIQKASLGKFIYQNYTNNEKENDRVVYWHKEIDMERPPSKTAQDTQSPLRQKEVYDSTEKLRLWQEKVYKAKKP